MKIRPATKQDVPGILNIFNREIIDGVNAFDTEPIEGVSQEAWFLTHLDRRYPVVVAEGESGIVGWASLSPWARHGAYERTAELSIFIHADHRGRGVGKVLLQWLITRARELGHHAMVARAEASNQASRQLHLGCGFSQVGVMHEVGWKHGRYLDVALFELVLDH